MKTGRKHWRSGLSNGGFGLLALAFLGLAAIGIVIGLALLICEMLRGNWLRPTSLVGRANQRMKLRSRRRSCSASRRNRCQRFRFRRRRLGQLGC